VFAASAPVARIKANPARESKLNRLNGDLNDSLGAAPDLSVQNIAANELTLANSKAARAVTR
jgi:hypothetical protein